RERGAADRQLEVALIRAGGGDTGGEGRSRGGRFEIERRRAGADLVNGAEIGVVQVHHESCAARGDERAGGAAVHAFDHEALLGGAAERDGGRVEVRGCSPEGADDTIDLQQRVRGGDPALIERARVDRVGRRGGHWGAGAGEVEAAGREVADRQDIEHGAPGGRGAQRAPDTGGSEA